MAVNNLGLKAYNNALANFAKAEQAAKNKSAAVGGVSAQPMGGSFAETLKTSIMKVNEMQTEKSAMIQSFASGENQNVHELMISLQKAGVAMHMTAAVRNKVLEAYRELTKMQF